MRFNLLSTLALLALASCSATQIQQFEALQQQAHTTGNVAAKPAPVAVAPAPANSDYAPVAFTDLPGWNSDNLSEALPALKLSCTRFGLLPQDQPLGGTGVAATLGGKSGQWLPACQAARALTPGDTAGFRAFLQTWFTPYQLQQNGNANALITGYYEPEVKGSRTRQGLYQTPLLARPRDLVQVSLGDFDPTLSGKVILGHLSGATLAPYFTRAEIEAGALKPQKLELLYLADPVEAFFMQIQGSGRVRLPDGEIIRVAYAGKNGLPYRPIGKLLSDQGAIPADQVSMQTIRAWLEANPAQAKSIMDQNPSYVFFRVVTSISADQGPPGQLGVSLTPERSLAVDREIVPLGAPMWLSSTDPADGTAVQKLMVAQDVGSAITGPLRADVFYGTGAQAQTRAGNAKQTGTLYLLLPKTQ